MKVDFKNLEKTLDKMIKKIKKEDKIIDVTNMILLFKKCIKKPIIVKAYQMKNEFKVKTKQGIVKGKAGDYIIEGIDKERYPCDKEVFEKTYDWINKKEDK